MFTYLYIQLVSMVTNNYIDKQNYLSIYIHSFMVVDFNFKNILDFEFFIDRYT